MTTPTSAGSGTQTATVTTAHTLATITTPGVYQLMVNTENMVLGDELELYANVKVLSGSTARRIFIGSYKHVQGDNVKISLPIGVLHEIAFILKQAAGGAGRDFQWNIISY